MKKILLVLVSLVVVVSLTAAASALTVNDSVLQVSSGPADITLPEPPATPVNIFVTARLYSGQSENLSSVARFGPYVVPEGATVDIGWDGSLRTCPSTGGDAVPQPNGVGEVIAEEGLDRVICVQTGQNASPVVRVDTVEIQSSGTPVAEPSESDTTIAEESTTGSDDVERPASSSDGSDSDATTSEDSTAPSSDNVEEPASSSDDPAGDLADAGSTEVDAEVAG